MNAERPLVAFILVVVRRTLSPDELVQNHDCRRQIAAVQLYAHSSGRTISRILRVQTTYRGTIFYRSVGFRSAVEQSKAENADIVVADIMDLMKNLSAEDMKKGLRDMRVRYPEVISAIHRKPVGDHNLRTTAIFKRQVAEAMKANDPAPVVKSSRTPSQVERASSRGGQSTRSRSDQFARLIAPVLADIVSKNPKLALAAIANALNELGQPAVRGGLWQASTVKNLQRRCEALGLLPKLRVGVDAEAS